MLGTAGSPGEVVVLEGWLVGDAEGSAPGDGSPSIPGSFLPSVACRCLFGVFFFPSCLSFPTCCTAAFLLSSQGGFGMKGESSGALMPPEKLWEETRDTSPPPRLSPGFQRCLLAGQRRAGCLHTQSKREVLLLSVSLLLPAWPPLRERGAGAFEMQ